MSGGIAYVYDPQQTFPSLLNREFVDIDPLDDEDVEFLRDVVRRHEVETGSPVAAHILQRWHDNVRHFQKVMPEDYKRVLQAAQRAEEQGISVDEAVMAAAHVVASTPGRLLIHTNHHRCSPCAHCAGGVIVLVEGGRRPVPWILD